MIPVKLENELKYWIDETHPYGVIWTDDSFRRINAIIEFLTQEYDKRLKEVAE
jgi:hypothetical protein